MVCGFGGVVLLWDWRLWWLLRFGVCLWDCGLSVCGLCGF